MGRFELESLGWNTNILTRRLSEQAAIKIQDLSYRTKKNVRLLTL